MEIYTNISIESEQNKNADDLYEFFDAIRNRADLERYLSEKLDKHNQNQINLIDDEFICLTRNLSLQTDGGRIQFETTLGSLEADQFIISLFRVLSSLFKGITALASSDDDEGNSGNIKLKANGVISSSGIHYGKYDPNHIPADIKINKIVANSKLHVADLYGQWVRHAEKSASLVANKPWGKVQDNVREYYGWKTEADYANYIKEINAYNFASMKETDLFVEFTKDEVIMVRKRKVKPDKEKIFNRSSSSIKHVYTQKTSNCGLQFLKIVIDRTI